MAKSRKAAAKRLSIIDAISAIDQESKHWPEWMRLHMEEVRAAYTFTQKKGQACRGRRGARAPPDPSGTLCPARAGSSAG